MKRLSHNGKILSASNGDGIMVDKFDWKDAFCDASITGGIAAFSAYAGTASSGLPDMLIIRACLIAFGSAFIGFLALKRGLTKKEDE